MKRKVELIKIILVFFISNSYAKDFEGNYALKNLSSFKRTYIQYINLLNNTLKCLRYPEKCKPEEVKEAKKWLRKNLAFITAFSALIATGSLIGLRFIKAQRKKPQKSSQLIKEEIEPTLQTTPIAQMQKSIADAISMRDVESFEKNLKDQLPLDGEKFLSIYADLDNALSELDLLALDSIKSLNKMLQKLFMQLPENLDEKLINEFVQKLYYERNPMLLNETRLTFARKVPQILPYKSNDDLKKRTLFYRILEVNPALSLAILNDPAISNKDLFINEPRGEKVNLDIRDTDDLYTPLILAANRTYSQNVFALIDNGANVNAQDQNGFTALMHAAMQQSPEIAEKLIHNGALIETRDKRGRTALMLAVNSYQKKNTPSLEVIRLLIKQGADLEAEDNNGKNVLDYASDVKLKKVLEGIIQKSKKLHF